MMSFFNVVVGVWTWVVCGSVVQSVFEFSTKRQKGKNPKKRPIPYWILHIHQFVKFKSNNFTFSCITFSRNPIFYRDEAKHCPLSCFDKFILIC